MALRLRRDVQKASYYVWFLGAEEAKGLRGSRVINSVLPYLVDRAKDQEPLKVTLQVSHKGIKIIQGSSKHFIPHSAITSSVQTDDIVACVLLLYNPATKCPLHVHAYRCDSETTAEALHQQLQILINRPENQKRFEELESRLGILQMPPHGNKSTTASSSSAHITAERGQKNFQSHHRRVESSPKRFSSSLGSDTGNSTRESECSEERDNISPMSRSPPAIIKQLQSNDLFDSLAAELRAKLNGNGPPLLLPPRDYDTVHRSKGNLAAIELRRCRNSLIVGNTSPQTTAGAAGQIGNGAPVKQVSSRGSSGIGSDLAPSPERQDLHSSSDDEHWSNEADNSVIALKPSQIAIERSGPMKQQHYPKIMNRKSAVQPPEDNYLRDLPSKPYNTTGSNVGSGGGGRSSSHSRDKEKLLIINGLDGDRSKTPASTTSSVSSWNREDDVKPIIMRSSDHEGKKYNRMHRSEIDEPRQRDGKVIDLIMGTSHAKMHDTDKYNEINRMSSKKLSVEEQEPPNGYHLEYDESDGEHAPPVRSISNSNLYHKDNLTDKQKFQEYASKKGRHHGDKETHHHYGGRQRYVDPIDLPFATQSHPAHNKYNNGLHSPERDIHRSIDHQRDRQHVEKKDVPRRPTRDREYYSHSNERNPYREPESLPYIESMEKMMKSSAMRYASFDATGNGINEATKDEAHPRVSLRMSYPKTEQTTGSASSTHRSSQHNKEHNMVEKEFGYTSRSQQQHRFEYNDSSTNNGNNSPKDRFKDAKEKFKAMERSGSRYSVEDKEGPAPYVPRSLQRRPSLEPVDTLDRADCYDNWSDEEESMNRSRSRTREQWEKSKGTRDVPDNSAHARAHPREYKSREQRIHGEISRDSLEYRDVHSSRDLPDRERREPPTREAYQREYSRDQGRGLPTRDYPHKRGEFNNKPIDNRNGQSKIELYPAPMNAAMTNSKSLSNLTKGYRHSYAEPVFARTGGRVGLAAVNPF